MGTNLGLTIVNHEKDWHQRKRWYYQRTSQAGASFPYALSLRFQVVLVTFLSVGNFYVALSDKYGFTFWNKMILEKNNEFLNLLLGKKRLARKKSNKSREKMKKANLWMGLSYLETAFLANNILRRGTIQLIFSHS